MDKIKEEILLAIGFTEASTFGEFCGALGDKKPSNKGEWRVLFQNLSTYQAEGLVEVIREGGDIATLQLTERGANMLKDIADARRPMFSDQIGH